MKKNLSLIFRYLLVALYILVFVHSISVILNREGNKRFWYILFALASGYRAVEITIKLIKQSREK